MFSWIACEVRKYKPNPKMEKCRDGEPKKMAKRSTEMKSAHKIHR